LLFGALVMIGIVTVPSSADQYREDAIKAAFLYRFTGYIEWPSSASAPGQFTIAVLGGDAVAAELGKLLAGHEVKGLPAHVRQIHTTKELGDAQMFYIGPEYTGDVRALIASVPAHVLVVTDSGEGLDDGGIVNFMLVDRRVRFEISLSAAEQAGLKVSSELLSVAARVRGVPQRSETLCQPRSLGGADEAACVPRLAGLYI
jgi:YfiR/HmsC-like